MTAEVQGASCPWTHNTAVSLDPLDPLLDQLAADLGGGSPATSVPNNGSSSANDVGAAQALQRQYSVVGQTGGAPLGQFNSMGLMHQSSLPQPMMFPMGLSYEAQQQLQAFGSAPDLQHGLPNSLTSANNASYGANGMLQNQVQPIMMFRPAFGTNGVMAGAGGFDPRPAVSTKSQSPSTSSGAVQAGDDMATQLCDAHPAGKGVNKGALAQKRFRERQKVSGATAMR